MSHFGVHVLFASLCVWESDLQIDVKIHKVYRAIFKWQTALFKDPVRTAQ
jgi:hypothetical protein